MPPPQNQAVTVSIWLGWSQAERDVFDQVVRAFQQTYPHINFDIVYVPADELRGRYEAAAYSGRGPSLVFGPAEWGPLLDEQGLVLDLSGLATREFLERINPAALAQVQYRGRLIGLPHTIDSAVVLYRNKKIISSAPSSFEDLVAKAQAATRAGTVGAFLERSFFFSAGHLYGLGGRLMDEQGSPRFQSSQGVNWVRLLLDFRRAGPVEFNAHRDLELFIEGKAGMIIDGTWNLQALREAIGEQNLAVDPWPTHGSGSLSGFIRTQNIYANVNMEEEQRYAALLFMGFLLAPEVQSLLVEAGHIPVTLQVEVDDPLIAQVVKASEGGAPFPIHRETNLYWDPLDEALQSVFKGLQQVEPALERAHNTIVASISDLRNR